MTPTITVTPTVTPTITVTPTVTPTPTEAGGPQNNIVTFNADNIETFTGEFVVQLN